ncbi:MAG: PAS domain S-box protein [Vulcanimicrobiota bacterium]
MRMLEVSKDEQFYKTFLMVFLGFLFFFALISYSVFYIQAVNINRIFIEDKINEVAYKNKFIKDKISEILLDFETLLHIPSLSEYFENNESRKIFEGYARAFMSIREEYDQIRIIDENGREVLKVSSVPGDDQNRNILQPDESQRDFFKKAMKLEPGEIYFSRLDLNFKNEEIEIPYKPVLRLVTPVANKKGRKMGVLVLNYRAANILDIVDKKVEMILTEQGHWMKGGKPEDRWGFVFNKDVTFSTYYPKVWQYIKANKSGVWYKDNQLFVFEAVEIPKRIVLKNLNDEPEIISGQKYWEIVYHQPKLSSVSGVDDLRANFFNMFLMLVFLSLIGSYLVTGLLVNRRRIQDNLAKSENKFRAIFNHTFNFIGLLRPDGVLIEINKSAINFLGTEPEDIIGKYFWDANWWPDSSSLRNKLRANIKKAAGGEIVRYEETVLDRHRQAVIIDFSIIPIKDEEGNVKLLLPEGRDITGFKRQEMKMKVLGEAVNVFPLGFTIADMNRPGNPIIYVNPAFQKITGYASEEVLETTLKFLQGEGTDENEVEKIREAISKGGKYEGVIKNYTRCGREFYNKLILSPIYDEQDRSQLRFYLGVQEDITTQKKNYEALLKLRENLEVEVNKRTRELEELYKTLQKREESFRLLAEHTNDLVGLLDREKRFLYVSPSIYKLLGYREDEVLGKKLCELVYAEDKGSLKTDMDSIDNREMEKLFLKKFRFITAGGDYRWFETYLQPIYDAEGRLNRIVISSRDINERRTTELALQDSERKLRAMMNNAFQFWGLLSPEGEIIKANKTALDFAGITEPEVLGAKLWKSSWFNHSGKAEEQVKSSIEKAGAGHFIRYETTHFDKDGKEHIIDFSLKPVFDETNQVILLVAEGRDITDLKKTENALAETNRKLQESLDELKQAQAQLVQSEKLASLGQLTAGIAHEINNPVNFISTSIQALKMNLNEIEQLFEIISEISQDNYQEQIVQLNQFKEEIEFDQIIEEIGLLVGNISLGARRTVEIVRGLKDFSRVDRPDKTIADINSIIDSTILMLQNRLKDSITVTKKYGDIPLIPCYPGKLGQVFMNLLVNSIQSLEKKNENNKIIQILTFTIARKRKSYLCVEIKDNGGGIPGCVVDKIFDPFFTTKEVGQGTCLGLSITMGIVKSHDGFIEVESEINEGSAFRVYLPLKEEKSDSNE